MGICPNCGSWVDDGDICMSCGGSGSYSHEDDYEAPSVATLNNSPSLMAKEAWKLYMDYREEEALVLINRALKFNSRNPVWWNTKAIILEGLKRYDESKECYDRSLSLKRDNLVVDNKARMIKDWARQLSNDGYYQMAIDLLDEAIGEISAIPTEEDVGVYKDLVKNIRNKM